MRVVIDFDVAKLERLSARLEASIPDDVQQDPLFLSALFVFVGHVAHAAGVSKEQLWGHLQACFEP